MTTLPDIGTAPPITKHRWIHLLAFDSPQAALLEAIDRYSFRPSEWGAELQGFVSQLRTTQQKHGGKIPAPWAETRAHRDGALKAGRAPRVPCLVLKEHEDGLITIHSQQEQ